MALCVSVNFIFATTFAILSNGSVKLPKTASEATDLVSNFATTLRKRDLTPWVLRVAVVVDAQPAEPGPVLARGSMRLATKTGPVDIDPGTRMLMGRVRRVSDFIELLTEDIAALSMSAGSSSRYPNATWNATTGPRAPGLRSPAAPR